MQHGIPAVPSATRYLHTEQPRMLITHRLFLDHREACCLLEGGAGGGGTPAGSPPVPGKEAAGPLVPWQRGARHTEVP